MKLMVADLKGLVLLAYPVVTFSGMLQLNSMWASTFVATNALPVPTNMQLFMIAAVIYPLILTGFFRLDAHNPLFPVSTIIFISALIGLVVYPLMALVGPLVGLPTSSPWLHIMILTLDIIGAFIFMFQLHETDLHDLSNGLIFGSLLALEISAMGFAAWYYNLPQQAWASIMKLVGG